MTTTEPTAVETAPKHAKADAADERIANLEAQLAEALQAIGTLTAASQPAPHVETPEEAFAREVKDRKTVTLQQMRQYDGTLYVKHNDPLRQFSCHQRIGEARVDFDLGPAGHPESIGIIPKLALEIRGVQRAWKRGLITISTDESMEQEIDLMMNQHAMMTEQQIANLTAPLQPSNSEKDIVTKPCLHCGRYGRDETGAPTLGIEGGQVFQRYADYMSGTPPLCAAHEHLSNLYVGTLTTDPTTGIQDWRFQKSAVGQTLPGLPPVDAQQERPTTIQRQGQMPTY